MLSEKIKAALLANPQRLWDKIAKGEPNECWLWKGEMHKGYGRLVMGRHKLRAHRLVFFLTTSQEPEVVRHTCDRPICCNPSHLLGGTQLDNNADRTARLRGARGCQSGTAKLTEQQVAEIKLRIQGKELYTIIAKAYGVDPNTIRYIAIGKSWRHVPGPIIHRKPRF